MVMSAARILRKHNWIWYSNLVDKCSNPDCKSKSQLEVHHIQPIHCDGEDIITNCIVLCQDCHRRLGFHSRWDYYQVIQLNWKIKNDNNILDKIPLKYKKQIIDAGFILNNKLIDFKKDEKVNEINKGWGATPKQLDREKEYQKLQIKRHTIKETEYQKAKSGFNQYCIDYDIYHNLIKSQCSGRW